MGADSKIEWTHHTFNPWRGCTHVSPGCEHCYAETLSKRNPAQLGTWGAGGTRVIAAESYWRQPERWNRAAEKAGERHRVFCASLADVFEDRAELVAPRNRLLALIERTPHLDWLLLTKRPGNIVRLMDTHLYLDGWPRNAWLGFTAEDQRRFDERWAQVSALLDRYRGETYRPPVIFVSAEPLLGPLDLALGESGHESGGPQGWVAGPEIDWLIVGGESGGQARPFDLGWARSLVEQGRGAGVPVFVKQLGRRPYVSPRQDGSTGYDLRLEHSHGGDPDEWPEDLRVREFPAAVA